MKVQSFIDSYEGDIAFDVVLNDCFEYSLYFIILGALTPTATITGAQFSPEFNFFGSGSDFRKITFKSVNPTLLINDVLTVKLSGMVQGRTYFCVQRQIITKK